MVSAWEIYWVLQLDSIGCFLTACFVIGGLLAGGGLFIGAMVTDRGCCPSDEQDEQWTGVKRLAARLAVATFIAGTLSAFVPSTKTAAAMIIVPAIANNETIQKEAADLYSLAKKALADAVSGDEKEAAK